MSTSPPQPRTGQGTENAQDLPNQGLGMRSLLVEEVLAEARSVLGEHATVESPSAPLRAVAQAVTEAVTEATPTPTPIPVAEPLEDVPSPPPRRVEVIDELEPEVEQEGEPVESNDATPPHEEAPPVLMRERPLFSLLAFPSSLSPRWRHVVNVAAITLAIWVPIAWAIAAL